MNLRRVLAIVVALMLLVGKSTSFAQGVTLESWYTYWGLGTARITWPGELNDRMDLLATMPGVSRSRPSLDMLGFYKPIVDCHRDFTGRVLLSIRRGQLFTLVRAEHEILQTAPE